MLVICDAMVIIHLAKITLLEKTADYFGDVKIPKKVYEEAVLKGLEKRFEDAQISNRLIKNGKIKIKSIGKRELLKKAELFNIFEGEAEAVASYWQEGADLLATDDDSVRKKQELLGLNLIGTPAIIIKIANKKIITKEKARNAAEELKKIGWFSNTIYDEIIRRLKNE